LVASSTGRRNTLSLREKIDYRSICQRFRGGTRATKNIALWDNWLRRGSLKAIGRAFGKPSSLFIASWPPMLRRPVEITVISGQTVPRPKSFVVRFGPKADKLLRRSDCPVCANRVTSLTGATNTSQSIAPFTYVFFSLNVLEAKIPGQQRRQCRKRTGMQSLRLQTDPVQVQVIFRMQPKGQSRKGRLRAP